MLFARVLCAERHAVTSRTEFERPLCLEAHGAVRLVHPQLDRIGPRCKTQDGGSLSERAHNEWTDPFSLFEKGFARTLGVGDGDERGVCGGQEAQRVALAVARAESGTRAERTRVLRRKRGERGAAVLVRAPVQLGVLRAAVPRELAPRASHQLGPRQAAALALHATKRQSANVEAAKHTHSSQYTHTALRGCVQICNAQ